MNKTIRIKVTRPTVCRRGSLAPGDVIDLDYDDAALIIGCRKATPFDGPIPEDKYAKRTYEVAAVAPVTETANAAPALSELKKRDVKRIAK
jgi:hypothetical protein